MSVGLQAGDRHEGVRTVEAIITNYREYLREMDRTSHVESLRLLTQQEKELRSELEGLQQEYYELRKESPLMDQAREEQQQMLQQLGRSMAEARNRKIELEHRIAALGWSSPRGLVSNQARQTATVASSFRDDELLARSFNCRRSVRRERATQRSSHGDGGTRRAMPTTHVGFAAIDGLASIEKQLSRGPRSRGGTLAKVWPRAPGIQSRSRGGSQSRRGNSMTRLLPPAPTGNSSFRRCEFTR